MNDVRTLVEIILSTPRVFLSGCCKARCAGNSGTIAQQRNAAAAAQEQPNVKIISTRVLNGQLRTTTVLAMSLLLGACAESSRTKLFESLPSPQRDYALDVYVIEPWFPHGPHRITIELVRRRDGARERLIETTLAYDGVPFTKQNIGVRWTGERAALVCLSATDRPDQGIRISVSATERAVVERRKGC